MRSRARGVAAFQRVAATVRRPELAIPLLYALLAVVWIAVSDRLVAELAPTLRERDAWSTGKGFAFVVVTAVGLGLLLRRVLVRERRAGAELARYRLLADHGRDIMLFVSAEDGRILEANAAAVAAYGWSREELLGLTIFELRDPATLGATAEQMKAADGAGLRFETVHRRRDGTIFPVEVSSHGATVDGTRMLLSVVRDVTARKDQERERERMAAALEQAARLEALGRLAGGVAHDFGNLLTVILTCAEELAEKCGRGVRPDLEDVAEIRVTGERARDLTRQLLTFARRHPAAPKPLDLNEAVRRNAKLLRRLLGSDVQLSTRLEPELWPVRCDPSQFDQVVVNLAVNARDAMPDGGRIVVETANVVAGEPHAAAFPGMPPGEYVRLSVQDSGAGMPQEIRERVFEPFFTTKEGKGTGLGLATAYGIVRQAGGFIRVESEPGRGTAFEIRLPRADAATAAAPASSGTKTGARP